MLLFRLKITSKDLIKVNNKWISTSRAALLKKLRLKHFRKPEVHFQSSRASEIEFFGEDT